MYLGRKKGWKSSKIVQALFERFPELQTYNEGSIRTYISNIFAKKDPKTAFQEWLQQKGYLKRKKKTISSSTFPKTIRIRKVLSPGKITELVAQPEFSLDEDKLAVTKKRIVVSILQEYEINTDQLYTYIRRRFPRRFKNKDDFHNTITILLSIGCIEEIEE